MKKSSLLAIGAVLALTTGCLSDPAVRNRFDKDPVYGSVYAPVMSCTFRTLEYADTVNQNWGVTKGDAMVLLSSTCRLPFDVLTDVILLPVDVVRVCCETWPEM